MHHQISEAARASGVSARMIRHYEARGLIPAATRGNNGYRYYHARDIHRLRFIHRARDLGFSLEHVQALLTLWDDRSRSSRAVKALAETHLQEIEDRILRLESMRDTLRHLIDHCRGDDRPDCPILDELGPGETGR